MNDTDSVDETYSAIVRVCNCCGAGLGQWHDRYCVYGLGETRTPVYEHQTRKMDKAKVRTYKIRGEHDGGLTLVPEEDGGHDAEGS